MHKIMLFLITLLFSFFITASFIVHAKSKTVIFVQKVNKSCKHLGSVSHTFKGDTLYVASEGYKVTSAGPIFADAMKAQAQALGANRLILIEAANDKTVTSGPRSGYHEWIEQSQLRARAFKC